MHVLIINPTPTAILNIKRMEEKGICVYQGYRPADVKKIIQESKIDLVIVFLKLIDPDVKDTLDIIFQYDPEMRVLGLANPGAMDTISLMEQIEFSAIEEVV